MRGKNILTIVVSLVIALIFCMPGQIIAENEGAEPLAPPLPFEAWGQIYVDGVLLETPQHTLMTLINDTVFGTGIIVSGDYQIDTLSDWTDTPDFREGGGNGDLVYYQLMKDDGVPGRKLMTAEETFTFICGDFVNTDLHFSSTGSPWPVKISSVTPNPSSGNDCITLCNPGDDAASLDDWKLRDRDGWEMALSGSIPSMGDITIDLGGDILSSPADGGSTAGDEISLCWQDPLGIYGNGEWVALDQVEYGNQNDYWDNTTLWDFPSAPAEGFKIVRTPELYSDNDNCTTDFIEEPVPTGVSSVYFAKTGAGIDHTPSIIQAANGSYFMAYEQGDATWHFTINMMWSPDGITWDMDNIIVSTGGSSGNRHPTLIQRQDGDLQVVYLTDRSGDYEIYTSISSDGVVWVEHGPLAVDGPAVNPFIIQEENGNYAMSYQRLGANPESRNGAYFTYSSDGITWDSGTQVSTYALPRLMKADGGDYLMTYQGGTAGVDFEIRYKTSSDGASWSSEQILTSTGNSHDSFPMQLANDTYMIFFCSSIGGAGYDLYRKWSPDMSTWSDDEYIETNNFRFDTEPHPCQVAGNQSFLLSWGYESSGAVGAYEDVDIALVWIEDITWPTANVPLDIGWNLISLPLIPLDTSIENVLSSISGQYSSVRTYNAWNVTDPWKKYRPGASTNDLTDLDHTMGIWIDANTPCTLIIEGTQPDITNITLRAGWNLVGYPSTVDKTVFAALTGTNFDRPVEEYDDAAPYLISQKANSELMTNVNGYWVHVPSDTVWVVDNVATPPPVPYTVYGYVYLYDGTSGGGYSPVVSNGTATLDVEWWNPSVGWDSLSVPVAPTGQFSVDLPNTLDGGVVYLNATFDAPYSNNGYNYTIIDHVMGSSMQSVVCGVPYDVMIMTPFPGQEVGWTPFPADYMIIDRDGMLAQGYYTFADGPFEWLSSDFMFLSPPPAVFDGTIDVTPGFRTEMLTVYDIGSIDLWVIEGLGTNNGYLTPWGEFYIDPDSTNPGWMNDLAYTFVMAFP